MKKFSDLKFGDYIYCLHLIDNINYDGNFTSFIEKEITINVEEIKIKEIIYPGIVKTGPYYAMTPMGNKPTYGEKESNDYVNIIYFDDKGLRKLILENKESSKDHNFYLINKLDGILFVSKEALNKYVLDYCNKYIHQYENQIKSIEEKKEKYQKFINAYRS